MHDDRQLNDSERKLLQILWNRNHTAAVRIDLDKLERLSGRKRAVVLAALRTLVADGYVEWDAATEVAKVLQLPGVRARGRAWGTWPD